MGFDEEVLPISNIKKEVLEEAQMLLKELSDLDTENQKLSQAFGTNLDIDKIQECRDKIQDLSSRFYELIPFTKYQDAKQE